jgi:hypothetical protein
MLAADNLGMYIPTCSHRKLTLHVASYGSLARYKDVQRLHPVGTSTIIGAGGDMSDFQYIQHLLDSLVCVPIYFVRRR